LLLPEKAGNGLLHTRFAIRTALPQVYPWRLGD